MTAPFATFSPTRAILIPRRDRIRARPYPLPFPFAPLFLLGFTLGIEIQFVGTLYAGEIALAMIALMGVCVNLENPRFWTRDLYGFLMCLAISCLAYALSDIVAATPVSNLLRGWARLAFLMADIVGLYVVCRKNRFNLFPLILGLALSAILMPHQDSLVADFAFKWKMDLYFSWVSAACILASLAGGRKAALCGALGLAALGVWSISLDARVVGAVCLAVMILVGARILTAGRARKLLLVLLILAAAAGVWLTCSLLSRTARQFAQRRQESDLARAGAILTALQNIGRHPLLGTGSWNVSEDHLNRHRANTTILGAKQVSEGMALGHSQILQAAVEGGIFGAAFFIYFLVRLIVSSWWALQRPLDRFSTFAVFNLFMCTWHTLFSSQGGPLRVQIATGVCLCLLLGQEKRSLRQVPLLYPCRITRTSPSLTM